MCVNRCPNDALFIQRVDTTEDILFDHRLCDGCRGETYCQVHCPEEAVTVSRVPLEELPGMPVSLISGEMAACQDCSSLFMPERKLATLLEQHKIAPKSAQHYCPPCRRNHLLDSYLKITGQI
jgi:ferredoxin